MSIGVLVLGDLGRSPRMQNHALSVLQHTDFEVQLIGYNESPLNPKLT
jgi:beta-1,4-mannosyltransferase